MPDTVESNRRRNIAKGIRALNRYPSISEEVTVPLLVAEAAIKLAVPPEVKKGWAAGTGYAHVVIAPSAQWVEHLATAVSDISANLFVMTRSEAKRKEEQSGPIGRALGAGQGVVAITPSTDFLPEVLKTVADDIFTIKVNSELVASVVKTVSTGRLPRGFMDLNVGILDFDELCGLITPRLAASEIYEKFARAIAGKTRVARDKENLPRMEDAIEFGDARLFAMDLKRDLADYKSGVIGIEGVDKGIVLHGPPGTGKTLYARSLGEYLGIPVVLSSMGELFANSSGYLDGVIKAQRDMFERARNQTPCVLFIDELDAVPDLDRAGHNRDWWAPVVNDFLTLLDGATSSRDGVIVVGATNRIAALPAALLRPGRFERKVYMGPPDADGVVRILRHHLGSDLIDSDLNEIAGHCALKSMTSAIVMEKVRSAKRSARREHRLMVLQDLKSAIVPQDRRSYDELFRVASHEAGHALAAILYGKDLLISVDIEPDGEGSGGSTHFRPLRTSELTRPMIHDQVKILLAGRSAEIVMCAEASAGWGGGLDSDASKATSLLASAALSYGLGTVPRWRCPPDQALANLMLDPQMQKAVEHELAAAADQVEADMYKNAEQLRKITTALMMERILPAARVLEIVSGTQNAERKSATQH